MSLNIDTETIRRLRDALLENGRLAAAGSETDRFGSADREAASLHRVAPFVETLYLVMIADGRIEVAEQEALRGALALLTHGILDQAALDRLLQSSTAEVDRHGVTARLQIIGASVSASRQDREIAFSLAAAVALADERLASQESSLLESIAEWYGVSDRRRQELLQQL